MKATKNLNVVIDAA
jgi:hypothetical protein